MNIRVEGVVHALGGATITCGDGTEWVIDYKAQSPFHLFHGRQVVARGVPYDPGARRGRSRPREPYQPEGSYIIGCHLRVSSLRPKDLTSDLEFAEVGQELDLYGQLQRDARNTSRATLSFRTDDLRTFLVANDPPGAKVGQTVKVRAYPLRVSPSLPKPPAPYLWIIIWPFSVEVIRELWDRGHRIIRPERVPEDSAL
jgi:hypothetical protein